MPTTKQAENTASGAQRAKATNAGLIELQIEYRSVTDIVLDPRNPRQHSQLQIDQIAGSIQEFGFYAPVVTDHAGQIVIGHARVLAAKKLGMQRIPVVEIRHLSKGQLKALRIADNRLGQNAHWDERLLGENFLELKELDVDFDLSITGFTLPEIDLSLLKLHESQKRVETDDDQIDAATGVPVCETGQIWQLGDHRLYCGDATSEAAFDRLMKEERADLVFVDPPFNVPVEGHLSGKRKVRHREFAQGVGELTGDGFIQFLTKACGLLARHSRDGAIHFVCMDWRHAGELLAAGREAYSELKNIATWVKSKRAWARFIAVSTNLFLSSSREQGGIPTMSNWANMDATARTYGITTALASRRERVTICLRYTPRASPFIS
jgi:hypothetical protein